MSTISLVVAMAKNRAIGINNTLPWRIPADLKFFKSLTMEHTIIMGRKTFDSIGKALPGRTTIVVTRNTNLTFADCIMAHSLEQALKLAAREEEIFIVGGAELYRQALPLADKLYVTEIQQEITGDAFFPNFYPHEWQEVSREIQQQETPQALEYHFIVYQHK